MSASARALLSGALPVISRPRASVSSYPLAAGFVPPAPSYLAGRGCFLGSAGVRLPAGIPAGAATFPCSVVDLDRMRLGCGDHVVDRAVLGASDLAARPAIRSR